MVGLYRIGRVTCGKTHAYATRVGQRPDHGLAFAQHAVQRRRLHRQRQLARLDQREVQNLIDQIQQVPARLQYLANAALLRRGGRRRTGFNQLCEPEDGRQGRAQLVAHAGEKIRLCLVGLVGHLPGGGQLLVFFLQRCGQKLALRLTLATLGDVAHRHLDGRCVIKHCGYVLHLDVNRRAVQLEQHFFNHR